MKFIFPTNYNFKSKIFGIIDYNVAIFNLILYVFVFCFLNLFIDNIYIKVIFFIILCFPAFILSIVGFNHENVLYVLSYLIKFYINRNIYLYKKY